MIDAEPVNQVQPPPEMLRLWAEHLIPAPRDVWYWDNSPLDFDLTGCQVMTRDAYRADAAYNTISYDNAYLSWKMPSEVVQLIISDPEWIGDLPGDDRQRVLQKQVDLKRGLVFSAGWFGDLPAELQEFLVDDQVVLGQSVWASLPTDILHHVLRAEQRRWDEVDCYPVPANAPAHVRAVANSFIPQEGTNCFAIAAYGATENAWLLREWFKPPAFHALLEANRYQPVPASEPIADDIVIFERDGDTMHAAWCATHDRFLNKNGQSWFNPVRIVNWEMLKAEWPEATRTTIYRRGEASNDE
ncbi:MAG: hypothetical protein QM589_01960 [Thermomicrobiales bacterium]